MCVSASVLLHVSVVTVLQLTRKAGPMLHIKTFCPLKEKGMYPIVTIPSAHLFLVNVLKHLKTQMQVNTALFCYQLIIWCNGRRSLD